VHRKYNKQVPYIFLNTLTLLVWLVGEKIGYLASKNSLPLISKGSQSLPIQVEKEN